MTEATEEVVKFTDFDADFQRKLVALQIRDAVFARRTDGLLTPDYFEDRVDATLFALAQAYFEKYKRPPADPATFITLFRNAVAKGKIRDDLKADCIEQMKALLTEDISMRDFAIDQVGDFARHQAVQTAMLNAFDAMERHHMDRVEELLTAALRVGPHADSAPYEYWGEIESRTQERVDIKSGKIKPRGISTGIPALDKVLFHKGWGKAELTVFLANAKRGKSMMLWDCARLLSLLGYNVLGVTLEMGKDIVSHRLDSAVSDIEIDALTTHILAVQEAVKAAGDKAKTGKFFLHEFPTGTFRPIDMENLLESYSAQGIKFDAIVVDYLDIMAPNRWIANEIENSRSIWVDMRAIAQREDAVMLTATQSNREGGKALTTKAEHAAEDYNKIRIADLVISINASEEEMAKGEARLFFAASRNQKGEFTLRIKRDLAKGRALTEVLGYE